MKRLILISLFAVFATSLAVAQKPAVWIVTDMSDKTIPGGNKEGTVNDPDDISAMAGYLILASEFDTRGITVASTHRGELAKVENQAEWCVRYFGEAYAADRKAMAREIDGFPKGLAVASDRRAVKRGYIPVYESDLKVSAERYNPSQSYDVAEYAPIAAILDEMCRTHKGKAIYSRENPLSVLCWGSLTEAAILVNYCIANDKVELLDRIQFIAHWTNSPLHQGTAECPECVANCREDAKACAYLKEKAAASIIRYYECAAIGQHGIVSGSQKGDEYYNQFKVSRLGEIFATGKYVFGGVDDSDSASYYVLLGRWGVSLDDINPDGSNTPETERRNEKVFRAEAMTMRGELLRRCQMVGKN